MLQSYCLTQILCTQISRMIAVLDVSKDFDTVPYEVLFSKLKHYGIDDKIWLWIFNFLLFVCLFVGLFHVGNWNFWLFRA